MSAEQPPPRLAELAGPAGDCVREALSAESKLEVPRFARLKESRQRRVQRRNAALGVLTVALVALPLWRAAEREHPSASIRAEAELAPERSAPSLVPESSKEPTPAKPQERLAKTAPALPVASTPSVRSSAVGMTARAPVARLRAAANANSNASPTRSASAQDASPTASAGSSVIPAATTEQGPTARACADLARAGGAPAALDCYRQLATGSGVTAELALFEQARLEGKVLRDPARALATLQEHRQRFPRGSLRPEVMLAQIEWLLAVGDEAGVLQVIDEALASETLSERTAELERLRARLRGR